MKEQESESFVCRRCKVSLPTSSFRVRLDRTNYRIKSCKACERFENDELRQMHKVSPKKPNYCNCCGKASALNLDHCHKNLVFRGWLCNSCNLGIANLGDSVYGLEVAISYLKREGKHDSI